VDEGGLQNQSIEGIEQIKYYGVSTSFHSLTLLNLETKLSSTTPAANL